MQQLHHHFTPPPRPVFLPQTRLLIKYSTPETETHHHNLKPPYRSVEQEHLHTQARKEGSKQVPSHADAVQCSTVPYCTDNHCTCRAVCSLRGICTHRTGHAGIPAGIREGVGRGWLRDTYQDKGGGCDFVFFSLCFGRVFVLGWGGGVV